MYLPSNVHLIEEINYLCVRFREYDMYHLIWKFKNDTNENRMRTL